MSGFSPSHAGEQAARIPALATHGLDVGIILIDHRRQRQTGAGLARGLEVEDPVSSPTFTLMHSYRGRLELSHYDAWMEGRERAFLLDGGAEELAGAGVSVIEWAENVQDLLPRPYLAVHLAHRTPETRSIRISVEGAPHSPVAGLLSALSPPEGIRIDDADDSRGAS